jgi:hypothetical protein
VSVLVPGAVGFATSNLTYTYPLLLSGVAPATGSVQGGLVATLTGTGFSGASMALYVGSVQATVLSATTSSVVFLVPALPSGATSLVVPLYVRVAVPGAPEVNRSLPSAFTYSTAMTPVR